MLFEFNSFSVYGATLKVIFKKRRRSCGLLVEIFPIIKWLLFSDFSNNNPYISYRESSDLKYAKLAGSSWDVQIVDSPYINSYSSLALDSSGNPHIGYLSFGNLKYASGKSTATIGSIIINNNDPFTSSEEVTLYLTYTAYGANVSRIRLSNDGIWDSETW